MGTELNLTEDQRRRIEDAKSAEEKVAIIMEAADAGMELSDEQLEGVSGGNVLYVPSTHAEIDRECDIVQSIWNAYGKDVAAEYAYGRGLLARGESFSKIGVAEMRSWMHGYLDDPNSLSSKYGRW